MRLHATFLLTVLALHARAATIPGPVTQDLQKKLPVVDDKKDAVVPAENVSSEQELIDSANTVKDIENNLRVKAIESIPVSVIVDGDVSNPVENEVTPDVKRAPLDLTNPGEPQRQEHETQNAIHFDEEQQMVTTVKQTVVDTENALKQGFQGVTQGIQNWIANNEQLSAIQASINNLQENFQSQISKLNTTIHSFWNNRIGSEPPNLDGTDSKPQIETVESHLKILENNFQTGVKALSEGVQVFATLKAENENPSSPTPTAPNNLFIQYLQLFQNTLTQGFNNVTHAIQNYVGQGINGNKNNTTSQGGILQSFNNGIQNIFNPPTTTPAGAQSDVEGSTLRPTIWQGIQSSLQNILNPAQGQNQASGQNTNGAPNRPIAQAIQNLPFVQGVVNLIQPNKPAGQAPPAVQPAPAQPAAVQPEKPAEATPVIEQGSNVVPEPVKPAADVKEPAKEEKPQTAAEQQNNNGPIRNIIQNNAIVKGISGAVQRLQASINNPEKPRDEEPKPEGSETSEVKGHYGYGGHNNNAAVITAWSNFVNGLIGTVAATINGAASSVATAVNSSINTLGTNIQVSRDWDNNNGGVVKSVPEKTEEAPQLVPEDIKVTEDTKVPKMAETDKTEQS